MGGSSAGSYLADPTSPIPSHCASIVVTSTVRVNTQSLLHTHNWYSIYRAFSYIYTCNRYGIIQYSMHNHINFWQVTWKWQMRLSL